MTVDTTTVNNWERNGCQPKLHLIPKIVQFLGYNPIPVLPRRSITEEIKAYRLMHGMSQKKMAGTIGIDPTTLARWERGKSTLGRKLKKQLNALIDYRLSDNNDGA